MNSLPGWEVILFPASSYFPGNDAPIRPIPAGDCSLAPNRGICLDCSGQPQLHRNVCGWHVPALHCVLATNCTLRVACKAESSAVWDFCVLLMKIPSLDTNCVLFMPTLFVYSDEICFIYVRTFVQFLWAK